MIEAELRAVEEAGGRVMDAPRSNGETMRVVGPESEVRAVAVACLDSDIFRVTGAVGRNRLGSYSVDVVLRGDV